MAKPGRKTKYSSELCRKVEDCMSRGMTLKQTSQAVGVHVSKLCKYQNLYPEFVAALEKGRRVFHAGQCVESYKDYLTKKIGRKRREQALIQLKEWEEKYRFLKGE